MDQLLDVGQAQTALGISRTTLFRLVRKGEIAVVKIGSRTLFRADDLHHFVDQHVRRREASQSPDLGRQTPNTEGGARSIESVGKAGV